MYVTGYDDITASSCPAGGGCYCGYINGKWTPYLDMLRLFSPAIVKSITAINGAANELLADICDMENGDYSPDQAANWCARKIARGDRPTVYCNTSSFTALALALRAIDLVISIDVDWWEARWDNDPTIANNSIGIQFQSNPLYDVSVFLPSWVGIPAPIDPVIKENYMPFDRIPDYANALDCMGQNGTDGTIYIKGRELTKPWGDPSQINLVGTAKAIPGTDVHLYTFDNADGTPGQLQVAYELASNAHIRYDVYHYDTEKGLVYDGTNDAA